MLSIHNSRKIYKRDDKTKDPIDLMREAGFAPNFPYDIIPDGKLHRFHVAGDGPGTRNGWAVMHKNHGAAGHWRTGAKITWSQANHGQLSPAQRAAIAGQYAAERRKAEAEQSEIHAAAAVRARLIWDTLRPAQAVHPYLTKKRIGPGPARQQGDDLTLPITDANGTIHGLQFIKADGSKLMLKGCAKRGNFIIASGSLDAVHILIAEGLSTALSAMEFVPAGCALAAIDAGNLLTVARAIRTARPDATITICADDDRLTLGNPGLTAARQAAEAVSGRLARPTWPPGSPLTLSDFNDLKNWLAEGAQ